MPEISEVDEVARDWDWYAVDASGAIGHFTSAGLRKLPRTVKTDNEAALRLIDYFEAHYTRSEYEVCVQQELESGTLKDVKDRDRYLRSFVAMAAVGLFSYDTYTDQPETDYFLVARPKSPLYVDDLPPEIGELLRRTKSTTLFNSSPRIAEAETRKW